ncbi:hypothetical protein V6N12_013034 [Hibiscus sabdariffa]|uniref:Uncharacterized protein n=1 Tax=Hibiscus sabdariffa TaxID=183260 RepID=A0ABR2EHM8_9ROSI
MFQKLPLLKRTITRPEGSMSSTTSKFDWRMHVIETRVVSCVDILAIAARDSVVQVSTLSSDNVLRFQMLLFAEGKLIPYH